MINFEQIVDQICLKSPLQKKKLKSYLATQPTSFFDEADKIIGFYMVCLC